MFKTKVQKIYKLQMEHFQNLIVNLSLKQDFYFILIRHFIIIIFLNCKIFVQILLILEKTLKFINMVPNIKRRRS
jgi:hypothetical protein